MASLAVTLVAVLGGAGGFGDQHFAATASVESASLVASAPTSSPTASSGPAEAARPEEPGDLDRATVPALPADSGRGKRIVFDVSDQRVWLVEEGGQARHSYLVSGSLTSNLKPGSYAVYSRSRWARGIDDSGVMEFFVRFARGSRAAIGFHSIPTQDGRAVQTKDQLGTPQSHGCIRQARADARKLWAFAPVGTRVVVTT